MPAPSPVYYNFFNRQQSPLGELKSFATYNKVEFLVDDLNGIFYRANDGGLYLHSANATQLVTMFEGAHVFGFRLAPDYEHLSKFKPTPPPRFV